MADSDPYLRVEDAQRVASERTLAATLYFLQTDAESNCDAVLGAGSAATGRTPV
jgi:hypothetical protein